MDWSILLFVLKWIFLGLVYLVLLLLLVAVQREMRLRLPGPAAASAFGRLRVLQGGSDGRLRPGALVFLQPETMLGSQAGADLVLLDRYISGQHARLHWDGIAWWVEDLNSTNGTFVDQQRVSPGAPAALPAGGVLQLGDVMLELVE
jgi:hypothetical protein